MNNELNRNHAPCALLQAKKAHRISNELGLPHASKRKAAQRILDRNERARQSTGAALGALILILVLAFQAS